MAAVLDNLPFSVTYCQWPKCPTAFPAVRNFHREACERMLFNSVLQHALSLEAQLGVDTLPYWPDRPRLIENVVALAERSVIRRHL